MQPQILEFLKFGLLLLEGMLSLYTVMEKNTIS